MNPKEYLLVCKVSIWWMKKIHKYAKLARKFTDRNEFTLIKIHNVERHFHFIRYSTLERLHNDHRRSKPAA